jgi:hypothetical protein
LVFPAECGKYKHGVGKKGAVDGTSGKGGHDLHPRQSGQLALRLFAGLSASAETCTGESEYLEACQTGATLGTMAGITFLVGLWAAVDVILGIGCGGIDRGAATSEDPTPIAQGIASRSSDLNVGRGVPRWGHRPTKRRFTMEKRVDDEREPTWWEQNRYKVTVFGFLVLMFGLLPLLISGR